MSQLALLLTLQVQPTPAVRVKLPELLPAATLTLVGLNAYAHPVAWLTVNARPPTVMEALRAGPLFAAAE